MLDFNQTFTKYESLVKGIEEGIDKIKEAFPEEVRCGKQCSDCCFAVFDLSLIEAVYLNYHFFLEKDKKDQEVILERANTADRRAYRIKRNLNKMLTQGEQTEAEILDLLSQERIECPLLNQNSLCDLYEYRPITCRVYGVPAAIHGEGHTCGKSGFREGIAYPTIHLDKINARLLNLSRELLEVIQVKDSQLEQRWVPLSTALLTDYDESYFGL